MDSNILFSKPLLVDPFFMYLISLPFDNVDICRLSIYIIHHATYPNPEGFPSKLKHFRTSRSKKHFS